MLLQIKVGLCCNKNKAMKNTKTLLSILLLLGLFAACSKKSAQSIDPMIKGEVIETTMTSNGITYKTFTGKYISQYKGILVMGSGNDENNPSPGALDGAAETDLCNKSAAGGYVAAIVQYRKTAGNADWNASAKIIGDDYNTVITALAAKYGIDKSRSVVGGYSYASFMLLTNSAYYNSIPHTKGILAACGATSADAAGKLNNPIFSIACSGNNEGDFSGKALYDHMKLNSPVKLASLGITDGSCSTHCGGNWTNQLYKQLTTWLP
jgi:hypothetical protein